MRYRIQFAAHLVPGLGPSWEGRVDRRAIIDREAQLLAWLQNTVRIATGGRACKAEIRELIGPDTNEDLTVILAYACAGPIEDLRIEFDAFDDELPSYRNIATVRHGEDRYSFVFSAERGLLTIGTPATEQTEGGDSSFAAFFILGVEHILTGYDHLLFLLALLIPGGSLRRLAGIVTAFTVAHSITLAASVLDVFSLPSGPVEIAIAASIVYVAAENLAGRGGSHRWAVTFGFGLIHGFGFAGILREAGLEAGNTAVPLLGFNLGVEAGQLAVVAAVVPLLRMAEGKSWSRSFKTALSLLLIGAGIAWILQRVGL